jgi:hypothetical protein
MKNPQISNFTKIRPVGAELFHAEDRQTDGREGPTDMTKLIVTFLNFAKATKTLTLLLKWRKDEIHTKLSVLATI